MGRGSFLRPVFQCVHVLVALALLAIGLTEFFNEPPLFDILGDGNSRPSLPAAFVSQRKAVYIIG